MVFILKKDIKEIGNIVHNRNYSCSAILSFMIKNGNFSKWNSSPTTGSFTWGAFGERLTPSIYCDELKITTINLQVMVSPLKWGGGSVNPGKVRSVRGYAKFCVINPSSQARPGQDRILNGFPQIVCFLVI